MGIPGAGKSRVAGTTSSAATCASTATSAAARCATLADALDARARGGRAAGRPRQHLPHARRAEPRRSRRPPATARAARCVWLDTPLAQAQVNLVERLLDRLGSLPAPDELRDARAPRAGPARADLADAHRCASSSRRRPTRASRRRARAVRARAAARRSGPGVFVAAAALPARLAGRSRGRPDAPHLVFDWRPDGDRTRSRPTPPRLAAWSPGPVEAALCPHPGGPADVLVPAAAARAAARVRASARRRPVASTLIGTGAAHRTLATALGARTSTAVTPIGSRR